MSWENRSANRGNLQRRTSFSAQEVLVCLVRATSLDAGANLVVERRSALVFLVEAEHLPLACSRSGVCGSDRRRQSLFHFRQALQPPHASSSWS